MDRTYSFMAEYYSSNIYATFCLSIHLLMDTWIVRYLFFKKTKRCQALVVHAYNPSYFGGRDQEDCGSKPTWTNSSWDPISIKASIKRGWRSAYLTNIRPWVHTPVHRKKIFSM
jgi:hypothetical protein